MRNHLKRISLTAICFALCLGVVSCRTPDQTEIQETTVSIPKTQDAAETSSASQNTNEISTTTMPTFVGNKDYFLNHPYDHLPYQNGDGITFELLSNPFKLGDHFENLGVRITEIDSSLYIYGYAGYLNLEKRIHDEWVRLEVIRGPYENRSFDEVARNRRKELLDRYSIFHMLECEIIPELTAGEYRFIAYFVVGKVVKEGYPVSPEEIRHYYIPFEITE